MLQLCDGSKAKPNLLLSLVRVQRDPQGCIEYRMEKIGKEKEWDGKKMGGMAL